MTILLLADRPLFPCGLTDTRTGFVHPERELFPPDEHSSYTAAAVLLAVDGITQCTQASDLFAPRHD